MTLLNQLGIVDIAAIAVYIFAMILIGFLASRRIKSAKDFSAAGQGLPWHVVAGSAIATSMGANMVIGKYDLIAESGLSGLTTALFFWLGWLFLIFMAKRLRNSGATSIPTFLAKRYNPQTQKISSYCVLIMMISSCAAQFLSIGTILEALGICSREAGVWIGATLIVLFTIFSGLWGVALTDTIQSVLLIVSFGIIFPIFVLRTAGGWNAIASFNAALSPERLHFFRGIAPVTMLGWAISSILATGSDPALSQRIFSAKDTKSAVRGQLIAWGATLLISGFVSALPGMAILKIFPEIVRGSEFTPLFIVTYMPTLLKGLMLATLLGLMLTSGDTYLLLLSSTLTDDMIRPRRPDLDDRKLLFLNRLLCVLSMVVICIMALYVGSIYQLLKIGASAYGAGVFVPLLLGCFGKRLNPRVTNAAMLAGALCSFCFDMFLKLPLHLDMDGVLIGSALCLVICVAGSHRRPHGLRPRR